MLMDWIRVRTMLRVTLMKKNKVLNKEFIERLCKHSFLLIYSVIHHDGVVSVRNSFKFGVRFFDCISVPVHTLSTFIETVVNISRVPIIATNSMLLSRFKFYKIRLRIFLLHSIRNFL